VIVRRARVEDADSIERVRTDTWRDAYRGLMPDSLLERLGYDSTRRRALMVALPPHQFVLVAESEGAVVGFCLGGRSRATDDPFRGEVYAIYVLPEYQGLKAGDVIPIGRGGGFPVTAIEPYRALEPAAFLMTRRMLLGLKRRAETLSAADRSRHAA